MPDETRPDDLSPTDSGADEATPSFMTEATAGPAAGSVVAATPAPRPTRYAVIEESGGQRIVREGDAVYIDLHERGEAETGAAIVFDRVLAIGDTGGGAAARIGRPYIEGATVTGEIVNPLVKGQKIHIYKYKAKKGQRRKTGHRQRYTAVRITSIGG